VVYRPYNRVVQPVPPSELGAPAYETFFELREQPFAISTDPRFLFLGAAHRRAFEELLTGLRRREGLLLLTGDTGTGKTTLCRAVLEGLGARTFSALILNPHMTADEVLRVMLRDFGLVSREEIRKGTFSRADTPQLLDTLEGFLRSLVPLQSYAVVIIDEAQSLKPDVLNRVRMLGSYEQDGHRLLQIVLCGQPQLLETLQREDLRSLNERITRRTSLEPLPPDEVRTYVEHRLSVAGRPGAVTFEPAALTLVASLSRGLPLRVNLLCDRALEAARAAQTNVITPELVKRAARAVAGSSPVQDAKSEPASVATIEESTPELPAEIDVTTPRPIWRRPLVLGPVLAIVLAASAYAFYGWTATRADPGVPALPSTPARLLAPPAKPRAMPTDAELKELMSAGSGSGSGQLPDNRE
jgi:general secretion pathway protein A